MKKYLPIILFAIVAWYVFTRYVAPKLNTGN